MLLLSRERKERRTSTGSGGFSLLTDALTLPFFVLLGVLTLKETICPRIYRNSRPKSAKSPLPVDVRRSKMSLLKLPSIKDRPRTADCGPRTAD